MAGKRLGRGLEFLLSDRTGAAPQADSPRRTSNRDLSHIDTPTEGLVQLELAELQPNPFQPRRQFDDASIDALARSLRDTGVLQPIVVRRRDSQWQIIAGERRVRAARKAELTTIPALVRDVDDTGMRLLALVENVQRMDLDPIEKALSFQDLKTTSGWTHERIARELGMDRSSVSNFLRLLDLPAPVRRHVKSGALQMGHARALLAAPEAARELLAERVVEGGLSVRETERLAAENRTPTTTDGAPKKRGKAAWMQEMERNLVGALGCRVAVTGRSGKGRITLEVGSREEFDRIYELLMSTLPVPSEEELLRRKAAGLPTS